MKKFISLWSILSILSAAVAVDFYIAINKNANPTGEQILVAGLVITFFSILSLVFVGAHFEQRKKEKERRDTLNMYKTFYFLKGKTYEELKK